MAHKVFLRDWRNGEAIMRRFYPKPTHLYHIDMVEIFAGELAIFTIAMIYGLTLVTCYTIDFANIAGLRLDSWITL